MWAEHVALGHGEEMTTTYHQAVHSGGRRENTSTTGRETSAVYIHINWTRGHDIRTTMQINGKAVEFEGDTGASVLVLNWSEFQTLWGSNLLH